MSEDTKTDAEATPLPTGLAADQLAAEATAGATSPLLEDNSGGTTSSIAPPSAAALPKVYQS